MAYDSDFRLVDDNMISTQLFSHITDCIMVMEAKHADAGVILIIIVLCTAYCDTEKNTVIIFLTYLAWGKIMSLTLWCYHQYWWRLKLKE